MLRRAQRRSDEVVKDMRDLAEIVGNSNTSNQGSCPENISYVSVPRTAEEIRELSRKFSGDPQVYAAFKEQLEITEGETVAVSINPDAYVRLIANTYVQAGVSPITTLDIARKLVRPGKDADIKVIIRYMLRKRIFPEEAAKRSINYLKSNHSNGSLFMSVMSAYDQNNRVPPQEVDILFKASDHFASYRILAQKEKMISSHEKKERIKREKNERLKYAEKSLTDYLSQPAKYKKPIIDFRDVELPDMAKNG